MLTTRDVPYQTFPHRAGNIKAANLEHNKISIQGESIAWFKMGYECLQAYTVPKIHWAKIANYHSHS